MDPTTASYLVESEAAGMRALAALGERFPHRRERGGQAEETYHDTFDWRLYRAGLTCAANGGRQLTLSRLDGNPRERLTVEALPGLADELPPGRFRDALAATIEMRRLLPRVRVTRRGPRLRVLDRRDKTVVLCDLESGRAADPERPRTRRALPALLRVSAIRGYEAELERVRRFLEDELELRLEPRPAIEVALAAIGRAAGDYTGKLRLRLDPRMRADEAVRTILRALFETILANEDGVRRDLDSEFLHDFRVAVRRTRSCLGQVKQVLPADAVRRFRDEFAWLGRLTGPTRDLDVYLLQLADYRAELPAPAAKDLEPLEPFLRRRQAEEQRRLARALRGKRYRALLSDWRGFLDADAAPDPDAGCEPPANAGRPVLELAGERIARSYRRVLARGRGLDADAPDAALHRLRIEGKKLRYLLEFFGSLYDEGDSAALVKTLKRLQDNLGTFNDLAVQQHALHGFAERMLAEGDAAPGTLLALGRLVERLAARQARERRRFEKLFKGLADDETRDRLRRMLARREDGTS